MKFSACIEMLFGENTDFYDRFKAAKDAGFDTVEFWGWASKDWKRIALIRDEYGINIAAICVDSDLPSADIFKSKQLVDRTGEKAFLEAVERTIEVAGTLGTKILLLSVGGERNDLPRYTQHANIVRALRSAAPLLRGTGMKIAVEPLNITTDHFGYFLSSSAEAFAILDEVDEPEICLLFDIYHQQCGEGNLTANITKNIDKICHFHAADVPGRHEPGTGEINYGNLFAAIEKAGYTGFVGMEYMPLGKTADGLGYLKGM